MKTLTRDSKQTIAERAARDPDFAKALLSEAASLPSLATFFLAFVGKVCG